MSPVDLLDQWTARSGGAGFPFVTYYDLGTGERVELSGTTMRNWIAKTSSLLVDELDAEPGTRLWVGLPTHWLRTVWILAAWTVGTPLVDSAGDIAVTGPDLDLGTSPAARHRLASALLPFGVRFPEPPVNFLDLGDVLPGQPDEFVPFSRPADSDPAVELGSRRQTRAELIASVVPSAERLLLTPGSLSRDIDAIVAAALGGGSIVLVSGIGAQDGDAKAARLAQQERARIA
jgi:uncharacterized protein (TIGR03089 family)